MIYHADNGAYCERGMDMEKKERTITNRQLILYMITAYGVAWVIQVMASFFANRGGINNRSIFQILMMVCMWAPFLAVLIAKIPLKDMGWGLHLKGKVRWVFFALWLPLLINILGAVLYFLVFPGHFDTGFETMRLTLGEEGLAQLEAQGLTVEAYVYACLLPSVTIAPFINILPSLGEEVGWRGALYPALKERFGRTQGRILGGICWGAWHWPVMILAGYEYGKVYLGAPVLGPIAFCLFATFGGILMDQVYEKTGSIWLPSLMHGAFNALTITIYLIKPEYVDRIILGPHPTGIISMIPMAGIALWICLKERGR